MPGEGLETHELREQLEETRERAEHAGHGHGHGDGEGGGARWILYLSLSTAIVAVFAAIASLQSGANESHALLEKNEAVLAQSQAGDKWAHFQAKSTKGALYEVQKVVADGSANPTLAATLKAEAERYDREKELIAKEAEKLTEKVKEHDEQGERFFHKHHRFALAVTIFQVSIALSAIAALARKQALWWVSIAVGFVGFAYFALGFGVFGG
jgi:Domain of unknown function (DUF4337)